MPQPLPLPGGQPTRTGMPSARQRSRRDFMSGIEPAMAGIRGRPSSSSSASAAVKLGMREMDVSLKNFAVFSHFEGATRYAGKREGDISVVLVRVPLAFLPTGGWLQRWMSKKPA